MTEQNDPSDAIKDTTDTSRRVIEPSKLGEYISFDRCSRYFGFEVGEYGGSEYHHAAEYDEAFRPMNPLLAKAGDEFEDYVERHIATEAELHDLASPDDDQQEASTLGDWEQVETDHNTVVEVCRTAVATGGPKLDESGAFLMDDDDDDGDNDDDVGRAWDGFEDGPWALTQVTLVTTVGGWLLPGAADLIVVWPTSNGAHLRVFDIKSSGEEKTYHRIQTSCYALALQALLEDTAVDQSIAPQSGDSHRSLAESVSISAGVITRATDIEGAAITPPELPSYDGEYYANEIRRLCADGGELEQLWTTGLTDLEYTIESKCAQCPYNEACATDAIESAGLELLGLSPGIRETLRDHSVTSITDVAQLVFGRREGWEPHNYLDPATRARGDTYHKLASDPALAPQLPDLVHRSQAMLNHLGETGTYVKSGKAPWLPRSGWGTLPDDDPAPAFDLPFQRRSMIRVYLNVQQDHLRDRLIQVSGTVRATDATCAPETFSELAPSSAEDSPADDGREQSFLEAVIGHIFDSIETVADHLDLEDADHAMPLVHFYTYTTRELTAMDEAVTRHDSPTINGFQRLWESRQGADQPIRSAIKPDLEQRRAIKTPSPGLLHMYDQLEFPAKEAKARHDWSYEPERADGPTEVSLPKAFAHRLFERRVQRETPSDQVTAVDGTPVDEPGPPVAPERGASARQSNRVATRLRFGAEIPLGYLYAANGTIDDTWVEDLNDRYEDAEYDVAGFRYHDGEEQEYEIHREDVETLGAAFAETVAHIERTLSKKSATTFQDKEPVDIAAYADASEADGRGATTLAAAANEYLAMEYAAARDDTWRHYRLPPTQRVLSGESIPVEITDITAGDGRTAAEVSGRLAYDHRAFGFDAPQQVKRRIRQRGNDTDGTGGGDWVVAHPVAEGLEAPYEIEQAPAAIIDTLAADEAGPDVQFELLHNGGFTQHTVSHKTPVVPPQEAADNQIQFAEGQLCLLEPQTDQLTDDRAAAALDNADTNALHSLVTDLRTSKQGGSQTDLFPPSALGELADWIDDTVPPASLPSDRQRAVIEQARAQLVGVQGPPGTGKTGGTLAPALLARCHAADQSSAGPLTARGLSGLVTAPSNKAIDELLVATAELLEAHRDSDMDTPPIHLYRIADTLPSEVVGTDAVTAVDYTNADPATEDALADLERALGLGDGYQSGTAQATAQTNRGQASLQSFSSESAPDPTHALVFATPSRAWNLVKTLRSGSSPDADEIVAPDIWHLITADEGSMLSVPQLLLAGANFHPDGQVIIGGDHRQLPPIHQYDWDNEYRRSVSELVPHLSALDYLRFLNGTREMLSDERRGTAQCVPRRPGESEALVEIGLDETFRFGGPTADFLREHVYARDDIQYTAHSTDDPIAPVTTDSIADAVLGDANVTVVSYDPETYSQMANPGEATLIAHLLEQTPDALEAGVVTPHNAQRGQLESELAQRGIGGRVTVDTVNRFQGGERPLMLLSGTVSDPEYIAAESEFLLNLNRLTVSASRHERQLVIVAARTLFEHIPSDIETYDEARLWKALAAETGVGIPNRPPATTLSPADHDLEPALQAELNIYHLE